MDATVFEGAVIDAVNRVLSGGGREDDRVEFKREWPDKKSARQLAGLANRAAGEYLIYVVGFDEKTGTFHPHGNIDVANWWSQLQSVFDQVAPTLERHLNVQVTPDHTVAALLINTEQAPYVVNDLDGGGKRDVPLRVGTSTRSAHRHELLQILLPAVRVPRLIAQEATLRLGVAPPGDGIAGYGGIKLAVRIYFERAEGPVIFMPAHDARIELLNEEFTDDGGPDQEVRVFFSTENATPGRGANARVDGLDLFSPGVAVVGRGWGDWPPERIPELQSTEVWRFRISLGMYGVDGRAETEVVLTDKRLHDGPPLMATWSLSGATVRYPPYVAQPPD